MRRRRKGFVLVAVSLFLLAIAGFLGVFLDLARVQTARRRIQIQADAAALDAVRELDGTTTGLVRARAVVSRRSEGAAVETEFWNSQDGEWNGNSLNGRAVIALRLKVTRSLPLYFMPALGGAGEAVVGARAAAAQEQRVEADGLFPYTATVDDAEAMTAGTIYELMWAAHGKGAAGVHDAINAGWPDSVVRVGDRLQGDAPEWQWQREALRRRIAQDADSRSADYSGYSTGERGNGRRIALLPLVNDAREVTGFGAFLLPPVDAVDGPPLRAEYVGAYLEGSRWRAASKHGSWIARLIQ